MTSMLGWGVGLCGIVNAQRCQQRREVAAGVASVQRVRRQRVLRVHDCFVCVCVVMVLVFVCMSMLMAAWECGRRTSCRAKFRGKRLQPRDGGSARPQS